MKKPNNKPKFTNTRKVLRKEKRQQKKLKRKEHYLKKKTDFIKPEVNITAGKFVKRINEEPDVSNVAKKKKTPNNQPTVQDLLKREQEKEKKAANKLKSQMNEQRRKMFLEANDEEDKIIKKLEKQLGLNKSRNKNNFFADDGLDYLLEVCDRTTSEQIVAAEKHLADVEKDSDFEEDLATVTGKDVHEKKKRKKEKEPEEDSDDEMDVDEIESNDEDDEIQDGSEMSEDEIDSDDENVDEDGSEMSEDENVDDDKNVDEDGSEMSEDEINSDDENVDEDESDKELKPILSKNKEKGNKGKKEKVISEEDISRVFSEDEVSHLSDDENLSDADDNKGKQIETEKPDVWEDIYGRKRDKEGNIIKEEKGTYIPPHLRNKDSASEKEIAQLKRQVKSVLNKLAGTNLHWACTTIENLYTTNSRHSVNTVLTTLYVEGVVGRSVTPDRMLAEHAAVIAVLHANVGSEIGAHFLEELCRKFDTMMQTPQPIEDKTLENLVACLAHLYCFKLYQSPLLFDMMYRICRALSEKCIAVCLACVRSAGGVLRKDAPAELKTFIQDVQARAAGLSGVERGSRIKYLLEVLLAIKNNNLNKIPNYDPSYVEHLRKMTRSIVRKGNYVTPLNIRLEDLLKAHERGKWWVVGSAWEGNRENTQPDKQTNSHTQADQRMMELARKQRMNTDVRRSIFCIIMSAEDYLDAFSKLQQLSLRGQQREVPHVLLSCCLHEKTYNMYYSLLAEKLCSTDRKYQLSIQYAVWDKIKDMENLSKQAMTNLAQFLVHLFISKALPLSVLKIIQFSDLNKRTVKFMRQTLLAVIMNEDVQASLEAFHRIARPPKLHMFRESLRLFMQHFLIKNAGKQSTVLSEDEMATLKERAQEVDKILTMHENKLRF